MMWVGRKGRIFVFSKPIDMRWGFVFFLGNNRRRLKGLRFDGSGLILFTKRMEKKGFMSVANLEGRLELTRAEVDLLIHGSVLRKYLPECRAHA